MTTPLPPPTQPALTRVCTVVPVLRFLRIDSVAHIIKIAHISSTFGDAIESYSTTVWRRLAARLEGSELRKLFEHNAFSWIAHNILSVGQFDVSGMEKHPLHVAAENGAVDVVRVCVAAIPSCVDVRGRALGETALHLTCNRGHTECVHVLLAAGADITVGNSFNLTALHKAADTGNVDVARLLVAHADFTKIRDARSRTGLTALHLASHHGHTECVREMLAAGADITVVDGDNCTAMHKAAGKGHVDVVRLFIAHPHFARIREARDSFGQTALHWASICCQIECARELAAAGADITLASSYGRTALHDAARYGDAGIVCLLVAHADFAKIRDERDNDGKTAMDVAKTEEIKQLLSKKNRKTKDAE